MTAYVVLRDEVGDEGLLAHCRAHLASFKVPKHVHRMATLPRTAAGKLVRRSIDPDLMSVRPRKAKAGGRIATAGPHSLRSSPAPPARRGAPFAAYFAASPIAPGGSPSIDCRNVRVPSFSTR